MELAKHPQTILAYEMNDEPLDVPHGAPLRLRIETQLGYKMVKWIKSIEFVSDYKTIGKGQGGHREDHMYYDIGAGFRFRFRLDKPNFFIFISLLYC
jgi:methionine sulfoxide reductase catalytic subunit